MLGRLQMSVNEAITHYGILTQRVFSDPRLFGRDWRFKASKLETELKEIVKKKTGQPDELMMDKRSEGKVCKT